MNSEFFVDKTELISHFGTYEGKTMSVRDILLEWINQYENDHYEFDVYGETVKVDLPRETVEKIMDIALLLCDRVVEAQGEVTGAEYKEMEEEVRKEYPDYSSWITQTIFKVIKNEKLFGRYNDIEPMIAELRPRGYPAGTAAYLLLIKIEIHKLIYAVIRHVDDIHENYTSLAYSFFIGILTKGWGEGFGWSKNEEGVWVWEKN